MAIKLQILQDVRKSGGKMFYTRCFHEDHISTKELAKVVQDSCTAKTSDVLAIINEFHFVFNMLLRESMQVKIDELGTFRL
ncbi:MAG: DNA-binding protein, partial [Prevotella sp.]|nr:DNA-binding protein [Candidatus Prevotella equi]